MSWLHTHFHLPFLACVATLISFMNILTLASFPVDTSEAYRSLPSITNYLGIELVFQVLLVCPHCMEVYPATLKADQACVCCQSLVFKLTQRRNLRSSAMAEKSKPLLQFLTKSIEEQLRDMLAVPRMEEVLEGWRGKTQKPGEYIDNFDGAICHELKGTDGHLFFENPLPSANTELWIGLTLGVDW
ncbi:hypothetical protein ARMSODRAFT_1017315 [Armillaria solidipes]|uniref:Uncharacterized protein n=1 Tax=Armillaria solidipes TaxID=1076256 RepID=A0A2H3BZD2_9AGAR|nr:hypothetical protein ARMSODRAFT_1017315 [Armillaria solidipes]